MLVCTSYVSSWYNVLFHITCFFCGHEKNDIENAIHFDIFRLVSGSSEEPPLHLHLNKAVRQIKVDEVKNKVLIRFRDGTQIQADKAIVAVPASVLAAQDLMFEPELPQQYKLAFSEMGKAFKHILTYIFRLNVETTDWYDAMNIFIDIKRK